MSDWKTSAVERLLRLHRGSGAWGYRHDRGPSAESTALACLGLLSCRGPSAQRGLESAIQQGADWLLSLQNGNGSLGISPALPAPYWATAHAILLWNILDTHAQARRRAVNWLLEQKGSATAVEEAYLGSVVGHDPTLIGWPWIDGTHSWVEPTAVAILALQREGWGKHPRVEEGIRLIENRALAHGGWNYGNTSVFGRELRPQPAPTGVALLALAGHAARRRPRSVDPAIAYLLKTLPEIRSPISTAWGTLGLRAWNACPDTSAHWMSESYASCADRVDAAAGISLLLLAGGEHSWFPGGSHS